MDHKKKLLFILKNEPDEKQRILMNSLASGCDCLEYPLYANNPSYDELIELIFEYDDATAWW